MSDEVTICSVCDAPLRGEIASFANLCRITSDTKAFGSGGRLAQCADCGTAQKPNDAAWQADCTSIYAGYESYAVSDGIEQSVRGGPTTGGKFAPRSDLVLESLITDGMLPIRGRLLDYGCGRGPTSHAAQRLLPDWQVDGYDLDDRAEAELSKLKTFDTLYSGSPDETISRIAAAGQRYDLIALIHVLEHIPRGHVSLAELAKLLAPGGRIVVQVPNRVENPFDLIVADHTIHFDPVSLFAVAKRSGLSVEMLSENWVVKELTLLAGFGTEISEPDPANTSAANQVEWLLTVAEFCREKASNSSWGIFGTSIIAKWMREEVGISPDFYVDEDAAKQGQLIEGVPVFKPEDIPNGANVLMAMAPVVAKRVAERLKSVDANFVPFPEQS